MMKLTAIALLTGGLALPAMAMGWAEPGFSQPNFSQPKLNPACQRLSDFRQSPIQTLPQPFEQGCAMATPLQANNPGTIVYVLKTGMKLPIAPPDQGALTGQQTATLNRLVEQGQAMRITWFSPATIGSHQFIQSMPEDAIFVAWNDLCTKFKAASVGCVESGAFRPGALAEILIRNKERTTTLTP